jgi:hypothetical protein
MHVYIYIYIDHCWSSSSGGGKGMAPLPICINYTGWPATPRAADYVHRYLTHGESRYEVAKSPIYTGVLLIYTHTHTHIYIYIYIMHDICLSGIGWPMPVDIHIYICTIYCVVCFVLVGSTEKHSVASWFKRS